MLLSSLDISLFLNLTKYVDAEYSTYFFLQFCAHLTHVIHHKVIQFEKSIVRIGNFNNLEICGKVESS